MRLKSFLGEEPSIGEVVVIYHLILRGSLGITDLPSKDFLFFLLEMNFVL